jgi:hypothetical protein
MNYATTSGENHNSIMEGIGEGISTLEIVPSIPTVGWKAIRGLEKRVEKTPTRRNTFRGGSDMENPE